MSEFVRRVVGKAAPPIAFFFCAALSVAAFVNYVVAHKFGTDFGVYWRTANGPAEHAYAATWAYPFPYAPTMLLWIKPLAIVPKWPAYFLFVIGSAAAFVLACRPYLSKAAIALVLASRPCMRGLFTGQVCAILAAVILWACGSKNRIAAGIAFGLVATIKPQLVLMAPLMLVLNRDWRAFVFAGVTFLVVAGLSVAVFGLGRWPEWLASLGHFQQAVVGVKAILIGVTPAMWAERAGLPPLPFMVAGAMAGGGLVYLCRSMPPLERSTAIVAGSLMAAPYALDYDLVALFPFLAMMVMRGRILGVLGLLGVLHPLPLLVTAAMLLRGSIRLPSVLRRAHA